MISPPTSSLLLPTKPIPKGKEELKSVKADLAKARKEKQDLLRKFQKEQEDITAQIKAEAENDQSDPALANPLIKGTSVRWGFDRARIPAGIHRLGISESLRDPAPYAVSVLSRKKNAKKKKKKSTKPGEVDLTPHFLRLDPSAYILFPLTALPMVSAKRAFVNQYTISCHFRIMDQPEEPLELIRILKDGYSNEAAVLLDNDGFISLHVCPLDITTHSDDAMIDNIMHYSSLSIEDDDEAAAEEWEEEGTTAKEGGVVEATNKRAPAPPKRISCKIRESEWCVASLTVDCVAGHADLYLNGERVYRFQDPSSTSPAAAAAASRGMRSDVADDDYLYNSGGHHTRVLLLDLNGPMALSYDYGLSLFGSPDGVANNASGIDVRYMNIHFSALPAEEVTRLHMASYCWKCTDCAYRNGPDSTRCISCTKARPRSAPRPENDADPDHPGLTILVTESFKDIVFDKTKHVFVDVSADWCGACVQMYPEWVQLAKLLEKKEDIVIAKMDSDTNELDRSCFPENHVPILKLFKKGTKNKKSPVNDFTQGARWFLPGERGSKTASWKCEEDS